MRTRASQNGNGFTLVEMLVVVVTLPFVFVLIDGFFRTLLAEIPWSLRIAEENSTVLNMLEQVQRDVDKAKGLPKSFAGRAAGDNMLLIEQEDGVICYELKDGRIIRSKLTKDEREETRVWTAANAKVEWKIWDQDGRSYAVEARTSVEYEKRGQWNRKMANSHVYFAGALGESLRQP